MNNEEIYAIIQAKREERNQNKSDDSKRKSQSLSGASLKKYSSVLRSLYTALNSNDPLTAQFFSNHKDKVIELLKDRPPSTRRHIYTALSVFTNDEDFTKLMSSDVRDYKKQIATRERSSSQKSVKWKIRCLIAPNAFAPHVLRQFCQFSRTRSKTYQCLEKQSFHSYDLHIC